ADGGGPGPQRSRALPGSSRRLPPGSFTIQAESGGHDPQRANADPPSKRSPRPGGLTLHVGSPARCEQAGDGRGRRNRIPRLAPPPGFRPGPTTWPVHPPRAEGAVLETDDVTAAHRLAGEPSAPAWFTFHNCTLKAAYLLSRVMCPIPLVAFSGMMY